MSVLDSVELLVTPKMGIEYGEAARECVELACKEWRNVTLLFNGHRFTISPNDLIASIKEHKK